MNKRATFLSNRPLGKDLLDGQSQDYVALAIKKHIEEVDAKKDDENALPRIIGVEGSWGSGKSNMLLQLQEKLKSNYYFFTDVLCRLTHKRVAESGSGTSSLLETALAYDLHGWTTDIEVGQRSTLGALDTLFVETLHYASPEKDTQAGRFDGNISETGFKHRVGTSPSYSFQTNTWSYDYDGLKRLTDANHYAGSSQTSSLTDTEQGIDYDLNGNMTALKRYNSSGLENDLSFLHTGNRMTSLTDANAVGSGAGAKAFTYDVNGNMTHDGRKDLDIQWNIFNLASGAVTHDGSLTYARLSDGTLISSQNVSGSSTTGKRYCGSFVFATGTGITTPQVESIAWDEGRIFRDVQTGTYRDCWFAGDHLGDVRSVVDISPNLSSPVVLEQNDYLPFGTKIANPLYAQMNANRWRYAGKEEFPEVEMLDFGARLYDTFTARWTAVDPLAGKYTDWSPYTYCANNPVFLLDSNGGELDWPIQFLKGLSESVRESFVGIWDTLSNPIETAEGLYAAITHPKDSWNGIVNQLDSTVKEFSEGDSDVKALILGKATGEVLLLFVGGTEVKTTSKGAKLGKVVGVVNETSRTNKAMDSVRALSILGVKDGMKTTSSHVLELGESFLGKGYMEMQPGRFVSADKMRVFRMGDNDILGKHAGGPHVNIEVYSPNPMSPQKMKRIKNVHVFFDE